jgi:xylulokinase
VDPKEIKGVSYSGQMHGSVFLDEKGAVVRPCILWNDSRTWRECEDITRAATPAKLHEWVSNPAMTGFTAPKVVWLRKNEPENFKRVRHLMLPKDYIRYKMTGVVATEVSDAAGTVLFNVRERRWATELLKVLEIPASWMPPVKASYEVTGAVTEAAAKGCGLAPGTPVIGGGADNPCGAVGSGVVVEGRVMLSLGTSGVIFCPCNSPKVDPGERLHSFVAAPPDQWYLMGVVLSAGMCLRWYRDQFAAAERAEAQKAGKDVYDILMSQAAGVEPGAEGLYFMPYIMGERTPINDPHARGAYVGLSFRHGPAHMVRAIVEGISFALRDNMEVVRGLGVRVDQVRMIGGGAKSPFWRQMMADIIGCEIVTLAGSEGPAQGAAILAGKGVGIYDDLKEATDRLLPIGERIQPVEAARRRYDEIFALFRGLYPALKAHFRAAQDLVAEGRQA